MTSSQTCKYQTFVKCNSSKEMETCICMIDNSINDKEYGILTALLCISVMLLLKEVWTIITKLDKKFEIFKTARRNLSKKQETSHKTMKNKIHFSQPTSAEIQYNATEKRLIFHFCAEPDKDRDAKLAAASKHRVGCEKSTVVIEDGCEKSIAASEVGCKNSADYELASPLFCQEIKK